MDTWVQKNELSALMGISVVYFDREVKPVTPADAYRRRGRCLMCNAPVILRAWRDAAIDKVRAECMDPDATGPNTPSLERLRAVKCDLAKLEYARRTRELVPRVEVHEMCTKLALILRGTGDVLLRQFGQSAANVLDQALERFERELEEDETESEDKEDGEESQPEPTETE